MYIMDEQLTAGDSLCLELLTVTSVPLRNTPDSSFCAIYAHCSLKLVRLKRLQLP